MLEIYLTQALKWQQYKIRTYFQQLKTCFGGSATQQITMCIKKLSHVLGISCCCLVQKLSNLPEKQHDTMWQQNCWIAKQNRIPEKRTRRFQSSPILPRDVTISCQANWKKTKMWEWSSKLYQCHKGLYTETALNSEISNWALVVPYQSVALAQELRSSNLFPTFSTVFVLQFNPNVQKLYKN